MNRLKIVIFSLFFPFFISANEVAIDSRGKSFTLSLGQIQLLSQCATFKEFKSHHGPLSFKHSNQKLCTKENLIALTTILKNPGLIFHLPIEECLQLFELADYLKGPDSVLAPLAERTYNHLEKENPTDWTLPKSKKDLNLEQESPLNNPNTKWTSLLSERLPFKKLSIFNSSFLDKSEQKLFKKQKKQSIADKRSLLQLKKQARRNLNYIPHIGDLTLDYSPLLLEKLVVKHGDARILNLSPTKLQETLEIHKKIRSFSGIDAFKQYSWAQKITHLHIPHHEISQLDLKAIINTFPHLRSLNLAHNHIGILPSETFKQMPKEFKLNLSDNQITSIENHYIHNPGSFKKVIIEIDNNNLSNAISDKIFIRSDYNKVSDWVKSAVAKSVVCAKSFIVTAYQQPGDIIACLAVGAAVSGDLFEKFYQKMPMQSFLQTTRVKMVKILLLYSLALTQEHTISFSNITESLSNFLQYYQISLARPCTNINDILRILDLLEESENLTLHLQTAKEFRYLLNISAAIGIGLFGLAFCILAYPQIQNDLNTAKNNDPYRVKISANNEQLEYPSSYAYRLW